MKHRPTRQELEQRIEELETRLDQITATSSRPAGKKEPPPSENHARRRAMQQMVIDAIPQAIFWKDKTLRYLGCNLNFAERAGLKDPSAINGATDYDLPWDRQEAEFYRRCDKDVMESDHAEFNIVETQRNADGETRYINTNKIPLHNRKGDVIGILGTFEDITARLQAERGLANYRIMADTVNDLMAIVDSNHVYKAVNEEHFHAYGIQTDDIIGMTILELIGKKIYFGLVKEKIDTALQGETVIYEGWREFPKWGKRYLHVSYFPIHSEDGSGVTGVVSKIRDITETRKLEAQLQQAQKMEAIGRLAGGIAHDFNNILSVINGYSELCLAQLDEDNPIVPQLAMIHESGVRAARLTEQLLAFSRRQIIKPVRINLIKQLQELEQMLARLLGEHIDIELPQKSKKVWDIKLDHSQLEQIIINLSVNARDAMPEGGKLVMEAVNFRNSEDGRDAPFAIAPGDYVMLALSDNGSGMDQDTREKIFEPFYTTKDKSKGTGLGLSTVYGIVKQNNGYITVYSEPGSGTTFKLYFPRCTGTDLKVEIPGQDQAQSAGDSGGVETILLVEDDKNLRTLCVEILTGLGYTVLEATNGQEAIETASRFHGRISLLLTDVVMPVMSGPETASKLKERIPDIAVLFMSGYTENAIVHHGVLEQDINFIHKPVSASALATSVRQALQKAAQSSEPA